MSVPNKPIEWPNQFAHMLFSSTVMLGAAFVYNKPTVLEFTALSIVVFAAVKEWIDAEEHTQSGKDAFRDFCFFIIGLGISWIFVELITRFVIGGK